MNQVRALNQIKAKRFSKEKEAQLREQYKIPKCFNSAWELNDGSYRFDFCDESIAIYPDGRSELQYWALSEDIGHYPAVRPW
jgi:hypothetical protein